MIAENLIKQSKVYICTSLSIINVLIHTFLEFERGIQTKYQENEEYLCKASNSSRFWIWSWIVISKWIWVRNGPASSSRKLRYPYNRFCVDSLDEWQPHYIVMINWLKLHMNVQKKWKKHNSILWMFHKTKLITVQES